MPSSCLSAFFVGLLTSQIGGSYSNWYTGNGGPAYHVEKKPYLSAYHVKKQSYDDTPLTTPIDMILFVRFRRSVNDSTATDWPTPSVTPADHLDESSNPSPSSSPTESNATAMTRADATTPSSNRTIKNTSVAASPTNTPTGYSVSNSVPLNQSQTRATTMTIVARSIPVATTTAPIQTSYRNTRANTTSTMASYSTSFSASFSSMGTTSKAPRTVIKEDEFNRKYYKYGYLFDANATAYWTDKIDSMLAPKNILPSQQLSATTVNLSFPFLFYGHEVTQVTIATGGFLYMSDFLYSQLTFSQYIAPLMANFDLSLGKDSLIHYIGNGSMFVVWWDNVYLADSFTDKPFSFQVILYNTSEIAFVYNSVPIPIGSIPSDVHPVKVGLSDAYYMDRSFSGGYYERQISVYSRINVDTGYITDKTAVLIKPLPTCIIQKSCRDCLSATNYTPFSCRWCPELSRCSDGLDRMRQTWLNYGCRTERVASIDLCPKYDYVDPANWNHNFTRFNTSSAVAVILVTLGAALLIALVAWAAFAIRNPSSPSGQCLIEYRPRSVLDRLRRSDSWCTCCHNDVDVSNYVTFHSETNATRA